MCPLSNKICTYDESKRPASKHVVISIAVLGSNSKTRRMRTIQSKNVPINGKATSMKSKGN
jgi:hypothetical protein